jgi:hypothetical protein
LADRLVLSLWSVPCPDEDASKVECGLVGDGEFVGSRGHAAPLLEAVDAPFDGVPLLVGARVEAGRAATLAASS